jgi:phage baseplate assembly protein W
MTNSQLHPVGISLPFTINEFGSVSSTTDQRRIWANNVRSVIGTVLRERIFRQDFGTSIPTKLFDSVDAVTEVVSGDITSAFTRYLPSLSFNTATINYDDLENVISIEVLYGLPDDTEDAVTLGVASIDGTNIISEVIA